MRVQSLGWKDLLEEGMAPTPVFLPGESHGQRSLAGYSPWGHKESDTTKATQHAARYWYKDIYDCCYTFIDLPEYLSTQSRMTKYIQH